VGEGARVIEAFVAELRANDCVVHGPLTAAEAHALVVERTRALGPATACNGDVPFPELAAELDAITPDDPNWRERLPDIPVGITGARLAVADPATIALAAGPGSPRATSLLPGAHICLLRASDIVPSLAAALDRIGADLPSALTWIGGPSRTSDLEMIPTLGVHGPRIVEVVLIDG
jgi:hypothetical protein